MNRKKRSHKSAPPEMAGDVAQKNQKQNYGNRVQQDIYEMMTARFEIKNLTVEHVRNDRERMPVIGLGIDERPRQAMPA